MLEISQTEATRHILRKQHLVPRPETQDIVRVVRDAVGLHATIPTTPYLSLLARISSFDKRDLARALYDDLTMAKLRSMRRTIHIHPIDMLPMVYGATARMVNRGQERYLAARGVDAECYASLSMAILDLLREGSDRRGQAMSAAEIRSRLGSAADVPSVLSAMCDEGLLLRTRPPGGWRDRRSTYADLERCLASADLHSVPESKAVAGLVRRYLASFGPAAEDDVVWWTGLPKGKIRRALEEIGDDLVRVAVTGRGAELLMLCSDAEVLKNDPDIPSPLVSLLPPLDHSVMGYKDRSWFLSREHAPFIFDRSGNATSTILVDGQVAGVWDHALDPEPVVMVLLLEARDNAVLTKVRSEAQRIGHLVAEQDVEVRVCRTMAPLTSRTAGGFMSPLKGCRA